MLKEHPQSRPNIYQVLKESCAMQGREIPIKDVRAYTWENGQDTQLTTPYRSMLGSLPRIRETQHAKSRPKHRLPWLALYTRRHHRRNRPCQRSRRCEGAGYHLPQLSQTQRRSRSRHQCGSQLAIPSLHSTLAPLQERPRLDSRRLINSPSCTRKE